MKILAFRHAPHEDLGTLRPKLEERGFTVESVKLYEPGTPVPDIADAAALVFMGGPMCANDDLSFLHEEVDLIREAVKAGLPVLGICLGAQLIAKALGGKVGRSPVPEIGWFAVAITAVGRGDPMFAGTDGALPVFHWHQDMFEVPPGAELLATAPACPNQAFRHGRNIYGFQFHPEMTPAMIEEWQRHAEVCGEAVESIDPTLHAEALGEFCERIVAGWTGTF